MVDLVLVVPTKDASIAAANDPNSVTVKFPTTRVEIYDIVVTGVGTVRWSKTEDGSRSVVLIDAYHPQNRCKNMDYC